MALYTARRIITGCQATLWVTIPLFQSPDLGFAAWINFENRVRLGILIVQESSGNIISSLLNVTENRFLSFFFLKQLLVSR